MRRKIAIGAALLASVLFPPLSPGVRSQERLATSSAPSQSSQAAPFSGLADFARRALRDANAIGFIHVRDVNSGDVLHVSSSAEHDLDAGSAMRPLSVIKVYVAAEWIEHGFANTSVDCERGPKSRMLVDDVLISGCDSAGKEMALQLRRKLGSERMLSELRRYGLSGISLTPGSSDTQWAQSLSLGEDHVPVTPGQVSGFLQAIGQNGAGLFSARTARRLRNALQGVVQRGTAISIKDALANTGWIIGGKTGTGPGDCGDHCDGWFASLLTDPHQSRYVILVFIRGKGLGGGVAARTAASVAKYLIDHDRTPPAAQH